MRRRRERRGRGDRGEGEGRGRGRRRKRRGMGVVAVHMRPAHMNGVHVHKNIMHCNAYTPTHKHTYTDRCTPTHPHMHTPPPHTPTYLHASQRSHHQLTLSCFSALSTAVGTAVTTTRNTMSKANRAHITKNSIQSFGGCGH